MPDKTAQPAGAGGPGGDAGRPPIVLDPAQESLSGALRAGFNVLRLIMVVLLVAYFLSGWFTIGPGEQGLIVRLGQLRQNNDEGSSLFGTRVFGPGNAFSLPEPFEQRILVKGTTHKLAIQTFMFNVQPEAVGKDLAEAVPSYTQINPATDGAMFSGDRNLSHGRWLVEYRVADGEKFVAGVAGAERFLAGEKPAVPWFEELLRTLVEASIVEVVSGLPVERITRTRGDPTTVDFTLDVQRVLTRKLDELQLGVVVDRVGAETVEPGRVREAFLQVSRAQNERERSINEARQQREQILNEAAGPQYADLLAAIHAYGTAQLSGADEAALAAELTRIHALLDAAGGTVSERLSAARSRAGAIREQARREYEDFISHRAAWLRAPQVTVVRLFQEMRSAILSTNENEVFFLPGIGRQIEILINRDPQRVIESDTERYKRRGDLLTPNP